MNANGRRKVARAGKQLVDLLHNWYKQFTAVALVVAAFVFILESTFHVDPSKAKWWIAAVLAFLVTIFFLYAYVPTVFANWKARRSSRNPDLRILTREVHLTMLPDSKVGYRNIYSIKALRPNIQGFFHRISWSGPLDAIVIKEEIGGEVNFHRVEDRHGTDAVFAFEFPIVLGSVHSFGYEIEIDDKNKLIRSYVGASDIYFPEDKLVLQYEDKNVGKISTHRCIYKDIQEVTAIQDELIDCSGSLDRWEIPCPDHGKAYILRCG